MTLILPRGLWTSPANDAEYALLQACHVARLVVVVMDILYHFFITVGYDSDTVCSDIYIGTVPVSEQ